MSYYAPGGGLMNQNGTALAQTEQRAGSPIYYKLYTIGSLASTPVLAYHGYKRNKSILWAVVWGLFGPIVWPITVPVAFAQGYGKPKVRRNVRRRRTSRRPSRRTSRRR